MATGRRGAGRWARELCPGWEVLRVEEALDLRVEVEGTVGHWRASWRASRAEAVLAGHRAAEAHGEVEEVVDGELGAVELVGLLR